MDGEATDPRTTRRFRFADHPWLSLLVFLVVSVLVLGITGTVTFRVLGFADTSPLARMAHSAIAHVVTLFVVVPFVLRIPKGKRSLKEYVADIGLTRTHPLGPLLALALSCYLILAACQAAGSVVYRLSEGLPVTISFLRQVFDLSRDLPPRSLSPLVSLPSAFEEIGSRGVMLTLFLTRYSMRTSIAASAAGFAALHLLNLLGGREVEWVLGQVGWSFLMGTFYGYLFVRCGSLIPPMLVHYLGNVFVGSLTSYMQDTAPVAVQAAYGLVFSFGILPVVLMNSWIRYFCRRWRPNHRPTG